MIGNMLRLGRNFALLLGVIGCTKMCGKSHQDMSPEEVVEAYLGIALNMTSPEEKESLMEYTTGALREVLGGADDDTITRAYVQRKYQVSSYSVVERVNRTPRETEITFRLVYEDHGEAAKQETLDNQFPEVTTENRLSLIREDGKWLIRDILGNKTSIAFPLMPESIIKASP